MSYEFYLGQGLILIIPHRAAETLIITDMMTLSDDFHPVMYRVVTKDDTEYLQYHTEKNIRRTNAKFYTDTNHHLYTIYTVYDSQ